MKYADTFSYKVHALTFTIDFLANQILKKETSINFPQFLILLCFTENPGESQKFASEWIQVTEATVSYMIKKMTEKGYLQFQNHPEDRRTKKIFPTFEGSALIQRVYPMLEKTLETHIKKIPSEDVQTMRSSIDTIIQSIMTEAQESQGEKS